MFLLSFPPQTNQGHIAEGKDLHSRHHHESLKRIRYIAQLPWVCLTCSNAHLLSLEAVTYQSQRIWHELPRCTHLGLYRDQGQISVGMAFCVLLRQALPGGLKQSRMNFNVYNHLPTTLSNISFVLYWLEIYSNVYNSLLTALSRITWVLKRSRTTLTGMVEYVLLPHIFLVSWDDQGSLVPSLKQMRTKTYYW